MPTMPQSRLTLKENSFVQRKQCMALCIFRNDLGVTACSTRSLHKGIIRERENGATIALRRAEQNVEIDYSLVNFLLTILIIH